MARTVISFKVANLQTGAGLPGAIVSIYQTGTTTFAGVYDADTGLPIANPLTADPTGLVRFSLDASALCDAIWSSGDYTSPRYVLGFDLYAMLENIGAELSGYATAVNIRMAQTLAAINAAIPPDRALNADAVIAAESFKSIPYNQNIAARKVIGTAEAVAGEYTNGGDYDCSTMPRGIEFDVQPRYSATQDTIIRLGQSQSFMDPNNSNTLTLGKGRGAKIKRLSQTTFRATIAPLDPAAQEVTSGVWTWWPGRGNTWTLQYRASVACPSDTALTLPSGFSGLSGSRVGILSSIIDPTYSTGLQPIVCEIVDDTHLTVHNPNTSSQLGSTTILTVLVHGLTYVAASGRGSAVYSINNPTGIDFTFIGAGQSDMAVPMMGNGPASFDARIAAIASKKNVWYVNSAFSGSTILYGATTAGNEWWNQNTGTPGARTTALIAAINLAISSGAPAPDYINFDVGQSEALAYGNAGYSFVTAANWTAGVAAMLAYIRANTTPALPSLAFVWHMIGRWGSSGIDVGINVIRQAALGMCDGVNIIQGPDGVLASLRETAGDGVHYDERGQILIWQQAADIYGNNKLGTSKPLGPTIGNSGFRRVVGTLDTFELTVTPSSGSITQPAAPGAIALLPSSDPAGAPLSLDPTTPYAWVSGKLRIKTAAPQATAPYLCYPYGGAAVPVDSLIVDGSGYAIRSRTMLQAT